MEKESPNKTSGPKFFYHRWLIILCVATLIMIGMITIFSATQSLDAGSYHFLERQLKWLGIAVVLGVMAGYINFEKIRPIIPLMGLIAVGVLVAVLFPQVGKLVNGSRRWIEIGGMTFQPSEFAKIPFILLVAHYLSANQREIKLFLKGFFLPLCIIGVFCALVILEPDYGTSALYGAVGMLLLFLAGSKIRFLFPTVLGGLTLFGFMIYQNPVRLGRIMSFLDVEGNRSDGSYQLYQGWLAFGNGGLTGVGAGDGRFQNSFLPEAHTDFIFSIVGEEFGFMLTALIVVLFLAIFTTVIFSLRRAPNLFQGLLALGALLMISMQALINMGVVTGLLPTKGMSLPFISYGGSNLVVMCVFTGILVNCLRTWEKLPIRSERRKLVEITA